jgi:pimeloyl-ACP methyl ester carboxylesterase
MYICLAWWLPSAASPSACCNITADPSLNILRPTLSSTSSWSLGGSVAYALLARHTARVDNVVVAASTPGGPDAFVPPLSTLQKLRTVSSKWTDILPFMFPDGARDPGAVQCFAATQLELIHQRTLHMCSPCLMGICMTCSCTTQLCCRCVCPLCSVQLLPHFSLHKSGAANRRSSCSGAAGRCIAALLHHRRRGKRGRAVDGRAQSRAHPARCPGFIDANPKRAAGSWEAFRQLAAAVSWRGTRPALFECAGDNSVRSRYFAACLYAHMCAAFPTPSRLLGAGCTRTDTCPFSSTMRHCFLP